MTTELEQQFFNVFGIEPEHNDGCKLIDNYWNNENLQKQYKTFDEYLNTNCPESDSKLCYSTCDFAYDNLKYPDITAEKLLELICIVYKTQGIELTIDEIKKEVLNNCIKYKDDINKQQVQQLFKEEE